ncbi:MAG TPA: TonB-dependent receptor [Rhodothermales bacterium]|nr:TonB-dependent receptor [Rhodothermales bacterium]
MKNIFYIGFIIFSACISHAQTLTVKDRETNVPINLASLSSDTPKGYALTNVNGQVDISVFKSSSKIEIRVIGYKTETVTYAVLESLNFEILLTASTTELGAVVVSATRWRQSSEGIPSRISHISTPHIALYNPQTTADLLGTSGEVFIQKSQQGGGSPMIRGFATNRLLYTVDGVRMNSAIFRAGNIQNVISLDPLAIENTEVFFGPGSIIYGSDAIGGVMSFQTLSPQLALDQNVLISGKTVSRFSSANQEATHHFNANIGGQKWASVSSFTYSKFGDLKMGKNGPDQYLKKFYVERIDNVDRMLENPNPLIQNPSGYSQINLMQKIKFIPTSKWDLQYGFHYSETSEYARYDRLIEMSNGLPSSAVWNYGPQIWRMNQLTAIHNGYNKVYDRMSARLAEQYFEESRIDRRFSHFRLRTNLEQVQAYSANIDFEKNIQKHRAFYGVEYVLNQVSSTGTAVDIRSGTPILVPDRYPQSDWKSYALYANFQFVVSEHLITQAGIRVNSFDISSDFTRHLSFFPFDFTRSLLHNAATTGSLGMVFSPNPTLKINAIGSTGFRAPNVDDIGKIFDFASGEVVVPNTNLQAEYAYNAELSLSKQFGKGVKWEINGFYTYLDNAMVRRPFTVNGQETILYNGQPSKVYAIQNAAYGTVYGVQTALEIKLPAGFQWSSRYNYQLGKEEMDNGTLSRSRHAAPAFGITRLSFHRGKLTLEGNITYCAEVSYQNLNEEERQKPILYAKDADGNPFSPAWYTLNFKAIYPFHTNWTVSAGVENLTDQRYRPYSAGLVAPGRNLLFAVQAHF